MREIKFRVWDKEIKTMYYDAQDSYDAEVDCFGNFLNDPNYKVMQFTGLLDRLGKEIYEGDILSCTDTGHTYRATMTWEDNGFWILDDSLLPRLPYIEYREVIGNIYENPELLK